MWWIVLLFLAMACLGIRRIPTGHMGVVTRFGRRLNREIGPGFAFVLPFTDRLQRVSIGPLSVSLPPQSAITSDEIPIQLQASLDAKLVSPYLASAVRDWRILVISNLQALMKDKLEELDFDHLDEAFPSWIETIRQELSDRAAKIGVEIVTLRISNLSPRSKPA